MANQTLERLLFLQGNLCFFCQKPLARHEASVEHLLPSSKNGTNEEENCVACCKKLNALFGHISLKEKIRAILNQQHPFKCPAESPATEGGRARPARVDHVESNISNTPPSPPRLQIQSKAKQTSLPTEPAIPTAPTNLQILREHLQGLKTARPKKLATLTRSANARFQNRLPDSEIQNLILQLQSEGLYTINGPDLKYPPTLGK